MPTPNRRTVGMPPGRPVSGPACYNNFDDLSVLSLSHASKGSVMGSRTCATFSCLLLSAAGSGCVTKVVDEYNEEREKERALSSRPAYLDGPSESSSRSHLAKCLVHNSQVGIWINAPLFVAWSELNVSVGFSDRPTTPSPLRVRVRCDDLSPNLPAEIVVDVEAQKLRADPEFPGGLLVIKNCFGTDRVALKTMTVGRHALNISIEENGKILFSHSIPIEVASYP